MKQIPKSTQEFFMKDSRETGKFCHVERYMTKVGKHLREVTVFSVCRREDTTLIPEHVFRFYTSVKPIDKLKIWATRRWPSLENLTNADLVSETRKRGLYSLDKVPDDVIFAEALSRGMVTATPDVVEEPVSEPDPGAIEYDDDAVVDVAPKRGFLARFRRKRG